MVMARAAFGKKSAWHPYLVSTRRSYTMAHDKATIVSGGPRLSQLRHMSRTRALGYKRITRIRGKLRWISEIVDAFTKTYSKQFSSISKFLLLGTIIPVFNSHFPRQC